MNKYDARKLVYLMQNERFCSDDVAGITSGYMKNSFTYDKPILIEPDNSYTRMIAEREKARKEKLE